MPTLMTNCPRCGTNNSTFDTLGKNYLSTEGNGWVSYYEVPGICRHCRKVSIFILHNIEYTTHTLFFDGDGWKSNYHLNGHFNCDGYVSIKDVATISSPDHVPNDIAAVFDEGSVCHSTGCFNAAGAMFRLCLDMATKSLLPPDEQEGGPNRAQRTRLFDRLFYLFKAGLLPPALKDLATCVREDGNDAAHDGNLAKADAEDLIDFSRILLERIYTEPARLAEAQRRRDDRRGN